MPRQRGVPENIAEFTRILSARYGSPAHFNKRNPLDELIFIVCSLQTNEDLYRRTYANLRAAFPRFEDLWNADEARLAAVLVDGGLSNQKAHHLRQLFDAIAERFGRLTLAPLGRMPDAEAEQVLTSLPGVGKKTARCVLMYSLGRKVFPVDTNCWRICRRLGWIRPTRPDRSCGPRDMDRLQSKVSPPLRFSLHVNMVALGRYCCTPRRPKCVECPVRDLCPRIGVKGRYLLPSIESMAAARSAPPLTTVSAF